MESVSSNISYCRLLTCKENIGIKWFILVYINAFLYLVIALKCGGTWWSYQVRIGPVAFQSSRHFGNDEVIHLLSGLWMVSAEGT